MADETQRAARLAGFPLEESFLADFAERGYAILPDRLDSALLDRLRRVYDEAPARADPRDVAVSRSGGNTRVHLIDRHAELDALWLDPLLLALCAHAMRRPFKLGSLLSRTVHPGAAAQDLHVDRAHDGDDVAMLGFVWMIDAFRVDNGATQLVPGSHRLAEGVTGAPVLAVAPAGSLLVYDGAIRHGYSANRSTTPRRSIQGGFVLRTLPQWPNPRERPRPRGLTHLARYLLDDSA